jgi:ABC-type transport system substrate-binding protein
MCDIATFRSNTTVCHPDAERIDAEGSAVALRISARFPIALALLFLSLTACRSAPRDPHTVVFLIDSSPASLDPRVGTDAQSEHIDELLFDGLVARDRSFHFTPALASRAAKA